MIKKIIAMFLIVIFLLMVRCQFKETESPPQEKNHTSTTVLPDENTKLSINSNTNNDILNYDINKTDGNIILKTIPGIIEKDIPLGDLFIEYDLLYIDNAYRMRLYTITDEYELILTVLDEISISEYLDYETMSLDIRNLKTNELMHNPSDSEVLAVFWVESYLKQREQNVMNQISSILSKSKCMVGGSSCPFDAQLIFTYINGKKTMIRLATDSCATIVVGSSTYYDFRKNNVDIGKSSEVKETLLNYFSINSFTQK